MAQQLRAGTALADDLNPVLNTLTEQLIATRDSSSRGPDVLFQPPWASTLTSAHSHRDTQTQTKNKVR